MNCACPSTRSRECPENEVSQWTPLHRAKPQKKNKKRKTAKVMLNCYQICCQGNNINSNVKQLQSLNGKRNKDASVPSHSEDIGVFPKWSRTFTEFSEFRETDKITEAWIRVNLRIRSVICVFVVLWYHLCLSCKGSGFETHFLLIHFVNEFPEFSESNLGKTPLFPMVGGPTSAPTSNWAPLPIKHPRP